MKFLLHSDSPFLSTGFRNQSFLLAEHLVNDGNDVYWCAPGYAGMPIKNAQFLDGRKVPFTVLPGGRHPHAVDVLPQYLNEVNPHIYFTLLDTFMLYPNQHPASILNVNINAASALWLPWKSAMWFPSDGGYFPEKCDAVLRKFDVPIAMSKWGKDQVRRMHGISAEYIPHGVDTRLFKALDANKRVGLRQKYSKRLGINLQDKFIVGCVARNQPRKHMDRLIKAFSLFSKGKDDVRLLMHSDPQDPAQFNMLVMDQIKRQRIENKVVWTGMTCNSGFPDDTMHEIYNLMDVKFDTTSGEGFGITIIEAMACQVPPILTDYTTTREIVTDHKAGLAIKLIGEEHDLYDGRAEKEITNQFLGGWGVERGMCDIKHAAELLQNSYDDWKKGSPILRQMGENGRKAVLAEYDFHNVVWPQFQKLFKKMVA